jgi:hypothetical protein
VLGAEVNLIGNQFDVEDHPTPIHGLATVGNCITGFAPTTTTNCVTRITDVITVGGRLGLVLDSWAPLGNRLGGSLMPYVTGGWATGSLNFRAIPVAAAPGPFGVALEQADGRADGFYIGGGLDWKISAHAVIGIEYRHTDLGDVTAPAFSKDTTSTGVSSFTENVRLHGDSDMLMFRASLLFDPRPAVAPLK